MMPLIEVEGRSLERSGGYRFDHVDLNTAEDTCGH